MLLLPFQLLGKKGLQAPHQLGLSSSVPGPTVKSSTSNNPEWRYMESRELWPPSCLMLTGLLWTSDGISVHPPQIPWMGVSRPEDMLPMSSSTTNCWMKISARLCQEWAVLLRSVYSDHPRNRSQMVKQERVPMLSLPPAWVSSPQVGHQANLKNFWKIVRKLRHNYPDSNWY